MLRYNLKDFSDITFNGFDIQLPEATLNLVSELATLVGSPTYIRTPTFTKKDMGVGGCVGVGSANGGARVEGVVGGGCGMLVENSGNYKKPYKRNNSNRATECVSDEAWNTVRSQTVFQPTVIEKKAGLNAHIDTIRSALNKMSDKNYETQSTIVVDTLNQLVEASATHEDMMRVGTAIFEIASNNRFYSKMYADLYSKLINKFEIMNTIFETNFTAFTSIFNVIEYVSADENYDKFCKINKDNEKRKALSLFFVNLTLLKIIKQEQLVVLACDLMRQVMNYINEENKKPEVDEIIENVYILYNTNRKWFTSSSIKCVVSDNGESLVDAIKRISQSKSKSFLSLSNKTIFKCMDMMEA